MVTVIPDDELFRVNLRRSDSIQFSGSCYLEILRLVTYHIILCVCLYDVCVSV